MAAVGIKDRDPLGLEWLNSKEDVIMAKLSTHFYAKASLAEIQNLYRAVKLTPYNSYPALVDSLDRFEVDVTVLDRDLARAQCTPLDSVTRREILQSRLLKSTELAYFLRNQKFENIDALLASVRTPIERLAAFHREFGPADGAPGSTAPGITFHPLISKAGKAKPVTLNSIEPTEDTAQTSTSTMAPATKRPRRSRGKGSKPSHPAPDAIDTEAITQAVVNALRGVAPGRTRKGGQFTPSQDQLTQRPCYSCDGKSHTIERCFARPFADKATGKCDISKLSKAQRAILQEKIAEQRSSSPRRSGRDTPAREPNTTRRHAMTESDESSVKGVGDNYSSSCVCARLVLGGRAVAASLLDTGTTHNFVDPAIAEALGTDALHRRRVSRLIRAGGSLVGFSKEEVLLSVCRERSGIVSNSKEWFIIYSTGHDAIVGLPSLQQWQWVDFGGITTCSPSSSISGSQSCHLRAISQSRRARDANRQYGTRYCHHSSAPDLLDHAERNPIISLSETESCLVRRSREAARLKRASRIDDWIEHGRRRHTKHWRRRGGLTTRGTYDSRGLPLGYRYEEYQTPRDTAGREVQSCLTSSRSLDEGDFERKLFEHKQLRFMITDPPRIISRAQQLAQERSTRKSKVTNLGTRLVRLTAIRPHVALKAVSSYRAAVLLAIDGGGRALPPSEYQRKAADARLGGD
jgi:hypothetical protein